MKLQLQMKRQVAFATFPHQMSENKSPKHLLLEGIMNIDGEAIEAVLETGRQALDAWKFDPANWDNGKVCEVTLTLSQLYPEQLLGYIKTHMMREIGTTHLCNLSLIQERVEMHIEGKKHRLFRTAIVRFSVI